MQTINKKKVIKVTFKGDMKRMKATNEYAILVNQTRKAFSQSQLPIDFKFYYLDEDSEMISINSQYDLEEALDIEDLTVLKLTVSDSPKEARAQLCEDISDVMKMSEKLNESGIFAPATERFSIRDAFDTFRTNVQEAKVEQKIEEHPTVPKLDLKPLTDTELVKLFGQELPKCARENCNFQKKSGKKGRKDGFCCGKCRKGKNKHGMGCHKIEFEVEAVKAPKKPEAEIKEESKSEATDKEDAEVDQIFKDLEVVAGEVQKLCKGVFKNLMANFTEHKNTRQSGVVHSRYVCDGCEAHGIKGIRYKCSVCPDYDLCEKCEANGTHPEHPMLKIRCPTHAPEKIICQYQHIDASDEAKQILEQLIGQSSKVQAPKVPEAQEEQLIDTTVPAKVQTEKAKPEVVVCSLIPGFAPTQELKQEKDFKDTRTYADVVKGVSKPTANEFGYPVLSSSSSSSISEESASEVELITCEHDKKPAVCKESNCEYTAKVEKVESEKTRQGLTALFELGCANFCVNKAMLAKYNDDVSMAASVIFTGEISDSVLFAAFKED